MRFDFICASHIFEYILINHLKFKHGLSIIALIGLKRYYSQIDVLLKFTISANTHTTLLFSKTK